MVPWFSVSHAHPLTLMPVGMIETLASRPVKVNSVGDWVGVGVGGEFGGGVGDWVGFRVGSEAGFGVGADVGLAVGGVAVVATPEIKN